MKRLLFTLALILAVRGFSQTSYQRNSATTNAVPLIAATGITGSLSSNQVTSINPSQIVPAISGGGAAFPTNVQIVPTIAGTNALSLLGTNTGYLQINVQNAANAGASDYVLTEDTGTPFTGYFDIFQNNSAYNPLTAGTIDGSNSAGFELVNTNPATPFYLENNSTNGAIILATTGAGGTWVSNFIAYPGNGSVASASNVLNGTHFQNGPLIVLGGNVITGNGSGLTNLAGSNIVGTPNFTNLNIGIWVITTNAVGTLTVTNSLYPNQGFTVSTNGTFTGNSNMVVNGQFTTAQIGSVSGMTIAPGGGNPVTFSSAGGIQVTNTTAGVSTNTVVINNNGVTASGTNGGGTITATAFVGGPPSATNNASVTLSGTNSISLPSTGSFINMSGGMYIEGGSYGAANDMTINVANFFSLVMGGGGFNMSNGSGGDLYPFVSSETLGNTTPWKLVKALSMNVPTNTANTYSLTNDPTPGAWNVGPPQRFSVDVPAYATLSISVPTCMEIVVSNADWTTAGITKPQFKTFRATFYPPIAGVTSIVTNEVTTGDYVASPNSLWTLTNLVGQTCTVVPENGTSVTKQ